MADHQRPSRPGCFSVIGVVLAILVVLFVAGVTLGRGGLLFSPGALNAKAAAQPVGGALSHADIACSGCHPLPFSGQTLSDRCLACHTDLTQDPKNFHNSLIPAGESNACIQCHTDHVGEAGSLTTQDLQAFAHETVGYSLKTHQKMPDGTPIACAACHPSGYIHFDQAGCASCHSKLNQAFMASHLADFGPGCLACHNGLDTYGPAFDHSRVAFAVTGKHTALTCDQCHHQATTIADLKAAPQACSGCHAKDDIHKGDLGQDCAKCHTPQAWTSGKIDHNLTAFKLLGKHQVVPCQSCHVNNILKGTPQDCFSCHAKNDVHQGDLGTVCSQCHTEASWVYATLDHNQQTRFPLVGKHLTAGCEECHVNNVFKGTPQDCYSCHSKTDPHKGAFGQDCGLCHAATGWLPSSFDHQKTAFPLTGRHVSVLCVNCHGSGTAGMVFKGTATVCYACHGDPAYHQGLFPFDCASCHHTDGWTPASFNGPHDFDMRHGGASTCRDCHPVTLKTSDCSKCHGPGGPGGN